ncbi:hypothetical protein PFTANZ_01796, partial [Plasmodium falciparum Tanzania (2000708)]
KLKEENSGAKAFTSSPSSDTPLLSDFVKRPTYFRYLEEWGETFCRERRKRLEKIKEECTEEGDGRTKKCSGYGEHCETIRTQDYSTVSDFFCPRCGRHCSSYRKWITRKGKEYEEQQNAYEEQKSNYENEHNGAKRTDDDNGFCTKLKTWPDAAKFLERLKNGPCKTNKENGEDEIDFGDVNGKTFQHTKHCDPCSLIGAKCKNGHCKGDTNVTCNDKKGNDYITAKDIGNGGRSTQKLDMRVSDNSKKDFESDLKEACQYAGIFKGIKKDVWKCGYVCGVDICEQTNVNGGTDGKEYIQIRALLRRWLEYFLHDYNKIKHKISHCTNTVEGSKCIKDCVEQWIQKKRTEWDNIKKRFNDQYKSNGSDDDNVRSFLETFLVQIGAANANNDGKKLIKLSKFDNSCGCSADAHEQNKNGEYKDAIECMLKKLEKQIQECKTQHTGDTQRTCKEESPSVEDDDEPLEEEEEYTVGKEKVGNKAPAFCEIQEKKEEEEEKCEAAPTTPKEPAPTTPKKPAPTTPKKPPKPPKKRRIQPRHALDHPAVIPALMSSTIMWSIGIGFATFTYFFLKKKMKKMKKRKKRKEI